MRNIRYFRPTERLRLLRSSCIKAGGKSFPLLLQLRMALRRKKRNHLFLSRMQRQHALRHSSFYKKASCELLCFSIGNSRKRIGAAIHPPREPYFESGTLSAVVKFPLILGKNYYYRNQDNQNTHKRYLVLFKIEKKGSSSYAKSNHCIKNP